MTPPLPRALVSWSSGKDCAYALMEVQAKGRLDVSGLLTTINTAADRVAMHGTRSALMRRQAAALGLPVKEVGLPWPCSNEAYDARMAAACAEIKADGMSHIVFGDLHLEDIRAYRDERMRRAGLEPVYPLWKRDTAVLAREMVEAGVVAHVVCVDPRRLDASFAGRQVDHRFLDELPDGVDPCGENGEFHTCVTDAPVFGSAIRVRAGETVERDGFVYADLIPE